MDLAATKWDKLSVANSNKTEYLYGGKELPPLFGIDWYDSAARWQTTSGVFTSTDPLMEKYYSISPYAYCAGNPVNRIDPEGTDDCDKVVGAVVGVFTNVVPGTGALRDAYKPSDPADYNQALQKADIVSATAGAAMVAGGGMMASAGTAASAAGAATAMTIVGAPEGAAAIAGGSTLAVTGEALASAGTMMMANAADNAKDGYDRGKQNVNKDNSAGGLVNKEAGLPEVPVPEGYKKIHHRSHGRSVYTNGKDFISRDVDSHKGGTWKKAKKVKDLPNRDKRMGTYDENLNRIGD